MRKVAILALGIIIGGLAYLAYSPNYYETPPANETVPQKQDHALQEQNRPPEIRLLYPKGGENLTGVVEISWTATDPDGDAINITIQYTSDPEPFCPSCPPQKWHNIVTGLYGEESFRWDTTEIRDGKYMIKVIADDGTLRSEDVSGWFTISNG